jgi:hypothetical protein
MKRTIAAVLITVTFASHLAAPGVSAALIGDVNGDCSVNVVDMLMVAKRYGGTRGSLLYSPAYDLNHNGRIDVGDIQIVAAHAGEEC